MKVYIVNAFTSELFGGNPAAVVPLKEWLPESMMQQIAAQHNLPETAFIVPEGKNFFIRWFTPAVEVDLCGHATLAAAHVYFNHLSYPEKEIIFNSKSGLLPVSLEQNGKLRLDFPMNRPEPCDPIPEIEKGLRAKPVATFISKFDYMAVFANQEDIEALSPDFSVLSQIKSRGLIVTSQGRDSDFVSRGFFPQSGIDEDPVTGSAHTVTAPYWAEKLGKTRLSAIQLSSRKGFIECELRNDRVWISGHAKTYLEGNIFIS
ncbi:MAG: PhzF family phenazine biosynthesis protein [Chitinophagales bacterium]